MNELPIAILVYHRIVSSSLDFNLLNVSPDNFLGHMEELQTQRTVIPLDELIQQVRKGEAKPGSVAITFDDGYKDFIYNALPILNKYRIPATLFTPTGASTLGGYSFWWDRIEDLLLSANLEQLQEFFNINDNCNNIFEEIIKFQKACLNMPTSTIDDFLRKTIGVNGKPRNSTLSIEELVESLIDHPEITIGSHSVSHTQMSILPKFMQRIELVESKNVINKAFGNKCSNFFSLPYGHPSSWNEDTINIASSLGYSGLLTTQQSILKNGSNESFTIPRLLVRDWSRSEFKQWLKQHHPTDLLDTSLQRRKSQFYEINAFKKRN